MGALLSQAAGALFGSGTSSAPSVRKPVFEVAFGNASADEWAQALVGFSVESGFAPWADGAEILTASAQGPTAARGDLGSIKAGYNDTSADLVFTGAIDRIRYSLDGVTRFGASSGAAALCRLRVNQSYEQSKAGDIVSDLAQRAGVDPGSIEDGADYPFFAVDDRGNAWVHIAKLARNNGFAAYFSADGKLNFTPVEAGEPVQTFRYGEDILGLDLVASVPAAGKVSVTGEGAAGSNGSDAWGWLLKDATSVTSESGDGDLTSVASDASLRSAAATQTAADRIAAGIGFAALRGWLLTAGASAVVLGSAIAIEGAPQAALNGTCLVERVKHRYTKSGGFTTLIFFTQTSAGGSGGAGGGLIDAAKGLL
jgi:phage protein D